MCADTVNRLDAISAPATPVLLDQVIGICFAALPGEYQRI